MAIERGYSPFEEPSEKYPDRILAVVKPSQKGQRVEKNSDLLPPPLPKAHLDDVDEARDHEARIKKIKVAEAAKKRGLDSLVFGHDLMNQTRHANRYVQEQSDVHAEARVRARIQDEKDFELETEDFHDDLRRRKALNKSDKKQTELEPLQPEFETLLTDQHPLITQILRSDHPGDFTQEERKIIDAHLKNLNAAVSKQPRRGFLRRLFNRPSPEESKFSNFRQALERLYYYSGHTNETLRGGIANTKSIGERGIERTGKGTYGI